MNLFSELYNCYYQVVSQILRESAAAPLTRQQIDGIARSRGYLESAYSILPHLIDGDWQLLNRREDGTFSSKLKQAPEMPLTHLQRSWLKALLADPRISLFFTPEQLQLLERELADIRPLYDPEDFLYFDQYLDGDPFTSVMYREHFRTILQSIRSRQTLRIAYLSGKDRLMEYTYLPSRLEYSQRDNKFRLYALFYRKNRRWRLDVLNLARILSVKETGFFVKELVDIDSYLEESLDGDPLVLEITDARNALERTLLHFSCYQKKVERLEDSDKYRCTIYYDKRWETELLIQVLSFGPVLRVLGPESFLRQVRERVGRQVSQNPYSAMTEEELFSKLETSGRHASRGQYRDADAVIADVREKYGL